jgi:hypothetical protein
MWQHTFKTYAFIYTITQFTRTLNTDDLFCSYARFGGISPVQTCLIYKLNNDNNNKKCNRPMHRQAKGFCAKFTELSNAGPVELYVEIAHRNHNDLFVCTLKRLVNFFVYFQFLCVRKKTIAVISLCFQFNCVHTKKAL